jgi:hypothetical protein
MLGMEIFGESSTVRVLEFRFKNGRETLSE